MTNIIPARGLRFAIFALFMLYTIPPCFADPMTLESALASAYLSNPQLESQRAALRAADEEVAKALAGWRPSLAASASYGWQNQRQTLLGSGSTESVPQSEQMTINQPLFNGRTIPSVAYAKKLVTAGREELRSLEGTVLLNAISAYFSVLRDQRIVEAYRKDVDRLREIQKNTEARLRIGELTKTDAAQASARLLSSQVELAAAQRQLNESRASFEHVIGRPAEELVDHPLPELPAESDKGNREALARNPTLAQKRAEAEAAEKNVDLAVGSLLPSLSLQAKYGRSIDAIAPGVRENGISVMGQLNIPLYQGGAEEAAIRQAKERSSQALLLSYEAERQVKEDFAVAWDAFATGRKSADLSVRQASQSAAAYLGTVAESRVGARNVIDILNAEQELLRANVTAISQQTSCIIAAYRVVNVMGHLNAAELKLPVRLYDPADHYGEDASRWFGFGD